MSHFATILDTPQLQIFLKGFLLAPTATEALCQTLSRSADLPAALLAFLKNSNGSFSLVVQTSDRILLSRDRFGQSPLFYRFAQEKITFGGTLLELRKPEDRPDPTVLPEYLYSGYIAAPRTLFPQIHKVPAGTLLQFRKQNGIWQQEEERWWQQEEERWWQPEFPHIRISETEAVEETERLLLQAIRRCRDAAQSPVGTLLSGGIDSNLLTALSHPAQCSTIGFSSPGYDETRLAQLQTARQNLPHYTQMLTADSLADAGTILRAYGEPFANPSVLALSHAIQLHQQHAPDMPLLCGDGGDELFLGYQRYNLMRIRQCLGNSISAGCGKICQWLSRFLSAAGDLRSLPVQLRRTGNFLSTPLPRAYTDLQAIFPFYAEGADAIPNEWNLLQSILPQTNTAELASALDLIRYMPEESGTKTAIAGLPFHSFLFAPLLDRDLATFALSLPYSLKGGLFRRKYLLRQLARKHLPAELLRQKKRGFGVPIAQWLREPPSAERLRRLPQIAEELPLPGLSRGKIEEMIREHLSLQKNHGYALWALIALQEVL